ncbi:MAG: hypothetical protein E7774_04695 [Bradyrhizobium sp.]|nr:MAG: hypothetical protein E7774_04695 [Bradyrhizobium sp.]
MDIRRKLTAFVAASAMVLATVPAQAGNHWKFNVVNKSTTAAIEFRTQEDGQWSQNWIADRIEPGDTFAMDFGTDEGDCSVRTEIRFTDGSFFDADVDYCKVSTLYIHEDKLTWE